MNHHVRLAKGAVVDLPSLSIGHGEGQTSAGDVSSPESAVDPLKPNPKLTLERKFMVSSTVHGYVPRSHRPSRVVFYRVEALDIRIRRQFGRQQVRRWSFPSPSDRFFPRVPERALTPLVPPLRFRSRA